MTPQQAQILYICLGIIGTGLMSVAVYLIKRAIDKGDKHADMVSQRLGQMNDSLIKMGAEAKMWYEKIEQTAHDLEKVVERNNLKW
jgi:hypothetical protein